MNVTVKLFTTLADYVPGAKPGVPFQIELDDDATLMTLLEGLKLTDKEVNVTLVNGHKLPLEQELRDGDEVAIFPLIGGG